jgi:hypothetical protein
VKRSQQCAQYTAQNTLTIYAADTVENLRCLAAKHWTLNARDLSYCYHFVSTEQQVVKGSQQRAQHTGQYDCPDRDTCPPVYTVNLASSVENGQTRALLSTQSTWLALLRTVKHHVTIVTCAFLSTAWLHVSEIHHAPCNACNTCCPVYRLAICSFQDSPNTMQCVQHMLPCLQSGYIQCAGLSKHHVTIVTLTRAFLSTAWLCCVRNPPCTMQCA